MIKDEKIYKVLIVEDNAGDLLIVQDLLTEYMKNPIVRHAGNFKQAAALLFSGDITFDVILLDLTLPDKSGIELIKEMLQEASLCPIIILTGYEDIEFSIYSISVGISDYLLKDNLTSTMLHKSISYSIERKKNAINLEQSEKRYSDLFNLSPQPMWVYDLQTLTFIQVNNAAVQQYGYTRNEFMKMNILDLRVDGVLDTKLFIRDIQKGVKKIEYSGSFNHHKKSGETIDVEVFSIPLLFNGVECRTALAIDVTMKNLMELQITQAIIKAQEDERFEIGSELHDNVCQILAATLISLGLLNKYLKKEGNKYYLECKEYIHLTLNEIRNLSHRLAPTFFDHATLEEALNKLFDSLKLNEKYLIDLTIDKSVIEHSISFDIQLSLYRILQEILNNILKYSEASKIGIHFYINKNKIGMKVADNGVGYDMNTVSGGIGRANMKRRAALFAGKLEIHSSPGHGCVVEVEIPLSEKKELAEV